ncbi:hypothetical protein J5N97_010081 [Dioscorea zingiberensis]|uniref:BSD domain-containing protein n=1 Tax=Dioscorea zingiberensis TaxID=325984 RepID=A0A9D5HMH6_9LILI|nr:hypothetical protein J5N97_010081 [Dioscorea zingiberensis]
MSWLARSLSSTLMPADDDGDDSKAKCGRHESYHENLEKGEEEEEASECPTRGVKEDLSELTKTLSRQFWGVASFLAPPPSTPTAGPTSYYDSDQSEVSESPRMAGIRSDLSEIGGRFRSGISKLSSNKAVTEISKIASSFLPLGVDDAEDEIGTTEGGWAIGVTAEVLAFARNISMHPETWINFPLYEDDEEPDDFNMSDAQVKHVLVVQHHEQRLAALKIELCPTHMSEGCFWKIYFVLLHSRLNKHDAELLSTPQIVEARARWLQELQNQARVGPLRLIEDLTFQKESMSTRAGSHYAQGPLFPQFGKGTSIPATDFEAENHLVEILVEKNIDKSVIVEEPQAQIKYKNLFIHDDDDEEEYIWPEEETGEMGNLCPRTTPLLMEDVSFSDLEDGEKSP